MSNCTRFSQPKYHIPRWKTVPSSLKKRTFTNLHKNRKMAIKIVKKENFEKWKKQFLPHVPRITQPKNKVPRSKGMLCSPSTDTHESGYCGHPFKVSGIFPSTYHQGSAQFLVNHNSIVFWVIITILFKIDMCHLLITFLVILSPVFIQQLQNVLILWSDIKMSDVFLDCLQLSWSPSGYPDTCPPPEGMNVHQLYT